MANTYLTHTPNSVGNRRTWTMSVWMKISANTSTMDIVGCGGSSDQNHIQVETDKVTVRHYNGSANDIRLNSVRVFRDNNAWYHLVVRMDTTQSTASDRLRIYINGEQLTDFDNATYPSQNYNWDFMDNGVTQYIGRQGHSNDNHWNGLLSHFHWCDGYSYAPTEFGETDATTGEWKIKTSPSVNYGTNGFLILKDGITITDQSANSNNWSLGGGTLTKTEDNPSNVFATIQFVGHPGNVTLNNGNLVLDGENENEWKKSFTSTLGASSGKYYWEVKLGIDGENTTNYNITGIVRSDKTWSNSNVYSNGGFNGLQSSNSAGGLGIYSQTGASMGGALYIGGSSVALTNGDIVMYAVDLDNKKMWVGKNGVWANAGSGGGVGNPATGANELWGTGEFTTGAIYLPASSIYYDNSQAYNFGNGYFKTTAVSSAGANASGIGIFEYDVPAGYTALSTKGLNL